MCAKTIDTPNLRLVLESLETVRAKIDSMPPNERAELSSDWLALLKSLDSSDPWVLWFNMIVRGNNLAVGQCGFKGPPSLDGVVEIAYGVEPSSQGKGYATEAAEALTGYAFRDKKVHVVRAHTLPETNASTRVLTKCGFKHVGEVIDPDDGPVWRWEKRGDSSN